MAMHSCWFFKSNKDGHMRPLPLTLIAKIDGIRKISASFKHSLIYCWHVADLQATK